MLWILTKFSFFGSVDKQINVDNFPKKYSDRKARNGWIYLVLLTALYVCFSFSVKTTADILLYFFVSISYVIGCKELYKQYIKKEFKIFNFHDSLLVNDGTSFMRAMMEAKGYRPATLREMLSFGLFNWNRNDHIAITTSENLPSVVRMGKFTYECGIVFEWFSKRNHLRVGFLGVKD